MKNILLLGSSGFIGRNLAEYLGRYPQQYALDTPSHRELDLIDGDCIERCLSRKRYDVVINAAICNPRGSGVPAGATELSMDLLMFNNLERCRHLYGKMLYFGSGAEFNKAKPICSVKEDDFFNGIPTNDYGLAKYTIGRAIEASENIYNFRIFGLFGKYEDWSKTFISGACCKALKGLPITIRQNVYFDYLYIDDFCKAVMWFIDHDTKHHTYNVTSGKRIDLLSIAHMVREICKADVPIYVCKEGWANEYTAENRRLMEEFVDFNPLSIEDAIADITKYYKKQVEEIDIFPLLYQ